MEAETSNSNKNGEIQQILQSIAQAIHWTYTLFWQYSPQQGMLVWGEGYYNGSIKTRKTVQSSMEVTTEEVSFQRSQQLRELYVSLSAGESTQAAGRRPTAALSPEDLTETEWFYLMCVSFSFPLGVGLPGRAYAKGQHVWLIGANEADSKDFSRAILAKSAGIQSVVCIPVMDGALELGNTERVQEDISIIHHVKSFFIDHHHHHNLNIPPPMPPKPALSEHSTSNPTSSPSSRSHFHSTLSTTIPTCTTPKPPGLHQTQLPPHHPDPILCTTNTRPDDDDYEDEDIEVRSDSEAQTTVNPAQPIELMQLEMPDEIRLGSPEDASNNFDSDFPSLTMQVLPPSNHHGRVDSVKVAESIRMWPAMQQPPNSNSFQPPTLGSAELEELSQEDIHYSQTVSIILQLQTSPPYFSLTYSPHSAFSKYKSTTNANQSRKPVEGTSQLCLKYILFTLPYLYSKHPDGQSSHISFTNKDSNAVEDYTRYRPSKGSGPQQEELSDNHVLAERRRREKLNERFIILRSLVPCVTKMDKASILGDTIEYLKQLRRKIQELEGREEEINFEPTMAGEMDQRSRITRVKKRKVRVVEGEGCASPKAMETGDMLQVSIIGSDALVELQCPYKEGLLLDIMLKLREMCMEVTAVQCSVNDDFVVAELRGKVKENDNGKKASIVEVKKAVYQIVPHTGS